MQSQNFPLSKTATQAPSLQLAHSAAPVVPREKLIDMPVVCSICGVKKTFIYDLLRNPASDFPRPVRIGRLSRWPESAVYQWVQNRIQQTAEV